MAESGLHSNRDRYVDWSIEVLEIDNNTVVLTSSNEFQSVRLQDSAGQVVDRIPKADGMQFVWTVGLSADGVPTIVQGYRL